MSSAVRRFHGRAILVYLVTIVVPVCAFVWLGLQSFERQRSILNRLAQERLQSELETATREAAEAAFGDLRHPIVKYTFLIERGDVIRPALYAALPRPTPSYLSEAERLLAAGHAAAALERYQRVLAERPRNCLALQGVALSFERLAQPDAAQKIWRTLASDYADERTLSHRPFGAVAALNAGDTAGLAERIVSGRWDLPAEDAAYLLTRAGVPDDSPLFDRIHFARLLHREAVPAAPAERGDVVSHDLGKYRLYYRRTSPGRLEGFAADRAWMRDELEPQVAGNLQLSHSSTREGLVYGAGIGVVLIVLSGGILLLVRDVARESKTTQLRAEVVSGVTHELKTPITLIRLYGETLLRHRDLPESQRRESLQIITRESARLGRLIDHVLAFSRVDRGDETYDWQIDDPLPVIAGVLDDYSGWLERSGFELLREVPDALPRARFDAGALSQALVNLLDNAVKYSGTSRIVAVRVASGEDQIAIEVSDRGMGIPPVEHQKIFDRFYRSAKGSGKGGYGLGLYMVAHIMRAHGGRVELESQVGAGSTFRLLLPVAPA